MTATDFTVASALATTANDADVKAAAIVQSMIVAYQSITVTTET